MIAKGITLSEGQMGKLFPHYILISNSGVIISVSSQLKEIYKLKAGDNIHDSFQIIANDTIYKELKGVVGAECNLIPKNEMFQTPHLGGRFEYADNNDSILFIGDINTFQEKPATVSAHLLRVLIDNFQSGVLFEQNERKVLQANNSLCKLFNIPLQTHELVGMDCKEIALQIKTLFTDPEDFILRINEIVTEQKTVYNDILHLTDGRVFKRDFIPIEDKGIPSGFLWIYDDITEQINKENKIEEQREYYNQILNELPADIVIFSNEHKYLFINKTAIKDDKIREWLIGKDDYDYCELKKINTKLADDRRALFNQVVKSKKPQTLLNEHQRKDGNTEYILRIMYPSVDVKGNVKYVIGYGVDITDQMKDRKYAEIQESRIKNLFDIIRDGVFRCDLDGNINIANNSFQYILNRENEFNNSDFVNFYEFLSPDEVIKVKRNVHFLMETGEPQSGIIRIAQNDGSEKYLDYTFTKAIEDEDAAFVGRISDITEIVNKERSLKQIIEKEKELNNSKSQFVRITSHELRTPLAIIQANAEILEMLCKENITKDKGLNPDVMIGRITKEVKLMTEILNELMLISKIETGNIEFHPQLIDVSEFIHDITHDMFLPYTDGRSLIIDIAPDITTAIFDKKLMRHALVNLINNAFKYSIGKPPPVLSINMMSDSLVFTIKDFGIGIPKEDQKKLFTSFFRASNVGSIHGTGLGLTVIDYAVKKHFGTISFKSVVNVDTVFSISIPLTQRI